MTNSIRRTLLLAGVGLLSSIGLVAQQAPPPAAPGAVPAGGRGGTGRGGAVVLPAGDAKADVEAFCQACHPLSMITTSAGNTKEGWRDLIDTMVRLTDVGLDAVSSYLATNFPVKPERRPTLVSGPAQISVREWIVPTLGQRARDPLQLPDGMIWWTGQYGSLIGRLNPRTGDMQEFKLAADVRPHSITADKQGRIWYTGNANGTIGRLDPATGETTVYKMPDPAAVDPHTAEFDQQGRLWFTVQRGNMIGRLTPETGEIRLATLPTPNSFPYGIVINSQGVPWVACNGSNRLVSIDPNTMTIREYPTPTPATRIRRLALLKDDTVFYVDSARGYLGRMDPKTGAIKEWPSPSGPASHPYAIAVVNDIVWYNESNQRPDALVRFDPRTERFQSWAIPSGVGIIRHMRPTPEGNLTIHQSSSNRIGLVTIR